MTGMTEIIAAFLILTGMGTGQGQSTASLSDIYQYAPDGANYSLFLDTKAFLSPALKEAESVIKGPLAKELMGEKRTSQISEQITMARATIKQTFGMDPIEQLDWVSAWLKFESKGDPQLLVAAKGNWPSDFLDKMSMRIGGSLEKTDGQAILRLPTSKMALAIANGDTLLVGSAAWLEPRLAKSWVPAKMESAVVKLFKNKPHIALYSQVSPASGDNIKKMLTGRASVLQWPLLAHKRFGVAIDHRGFNTYWEGTNAKNVKRAKLTFEGGISLIRATHHAIRSMANGVSGAGKLLLAWLPGQHKNPIVNTLAKHGDTFFKLLAKNSGDGNFRATVKVDKRRKIVTVDAHGKSLSEILPLGGVPIIAGVGMFYTLMMRGDDKPDTAEKAKSSQGPIAPLKTAPKPPTITK